MNCYYLYKGVWYSEQSILNLLKNGELKDVYSRGVANIPSLTKAVSSERVEKVEQIKEKQDGINGDGRTEEVQERTELLGEKPEDQVTETGEKTAEAGAAEEVSFEPFAEVVRGSKTLDEAFKKVSKIKDVTEDVSAAFRQKYDPNGNLTPNKAFEVFYNEIKSAERSKTAVETSKVVSEQIVQPEEKVAETGEKNEIDDGATDGGFDGENADIPKLFKQYLLDNGYEIDTERYDVIEGTKEVTDESQESMINRIRDDEEIQMLETVVISYDERYKSFIKETKPYYMFGKSYSSSAKPVITYGYLGMSDHKIEKISPAITTEKEGTPQARISQKRQQAKPTAWNVIETEEAAQKVEKEPTKVAETAKEEPKVVKATGIKPTNLRDVYKAGRDVFGLNKAQALAQAIVADNVIGKIAKRRGVTKEKVYSEIEFRKSTMEDLSGRGKKLYQIIGENANLSQTVRDNLGVAREMESSKKDAKTIKLATGWERGADGKWRYEVPDGKYKRNIFTIIKEKINGLTLSDVWVDDALFKAYPNLKSLLFTIEKMNKGDNGFYDGKKITLNETLITDDESLSREELISSILVHEIQHAIQEIEGFARGGNTENGLNILHNELIQKVSHLPRYKELTEKRENLIKNGSSIFSKEVESVEKERDEFLVKYAAQLTKEGTWEAAKYEAYERLAGEVESRNVQTRMDYTPEQRRTSLLEETEDVSRDEQIILFQKQGNGKTAKGAIQLLEDGNAIIHALTDPNVSTPLHEIAHLYEKYMTTEERQAVLNWTGDKTWTVITSEKFARGFENYLATGKAPRPSLQKVFDRFKKWLTEIYNGITGSEIDIELNDAMRDVYAAMLMEGAAPMESKIKEIKGVFNDHPALSKIGTVEQYAEYINTIFPNSRVKDIVYHATYGEIGYDVYEIGTEANPNQAAYFGRNKKDLLDKYGYGDKYISVILNIENPYETSNYNEVVSLTRYDVDMYFKSEGFDGILFNDENKNTGRDELLVFDSDQIHILGSKRDINGFRKYVREDVVPKVSKKAARQKRFEEIDIELGNELENLAESLGIVKKLTGEQRAKLLPTVVKVSKLLAEKYALKGEELIDEIVEYFRGKNIELDDEILKEVRDAEKVGIMRTPSEGAEREVGEEVQPVGGVRGEYGAETSQDGEKAEEKVKQRRYDKTLAKAGGVFEQMVKEMPMYYDVRTEREAVENAMAWLGERTEEQAYNELVKNRVGISADRQDRRQLFLRYLEGKMNDAVKSGDVSTAEDAYEKMKAIRQALAVDYTKSGQASQTAAKFNRLSPESYLWIVRKEIMDTNRETLPETDIDELIESEDKLNKMSKDLGKNAAKSKVVADAIDKVVAKNSGKKIKQTNTERTKQIAQNIRSLKPSNWGITFGADPISAVGIGVLEGALEVTAKTVELSGNIVSAIEKGINYIKKSEWYKGLSDTNKSKVEKTYKKNTLESFGVDKISVKEAGTLLKKEVKDLKTTLEELVINHWETKNELGVLLSERIVNSLGLSESDAKIIEKAVQDYIYLDMEERMSDYLDVGVPKGKAARKSFFEKMNDFILRGDLDSKIFRQSFAESFNLTPDLTSEQAAKIMSMHNAVMATKDMGVMGDFAADVFAKELDKMIPKTSTENLLSAMIAADYANMLFGATTWYVNVMSALSNLIISPLAKTTDIKQWKDAIQSSKTNKKAFLTVNPFVEGIINYLRAIDGMRFTGTPDLMDILKNGDLRGLNKYISEAKSTSSLKVPELERQLHGKHRFVGGWKNPFNYYKYSGRALSAQDAFMTGAFEAAEIGEHIYERLVKGGMSAKAANAEVLRRMFGIGLTEEQLKEVSEQANKEMAEAEKVGQKPDKIKLQRRMMEIIRDKYIGIDKDELLDMKEVAKSQVFNNDRGGVINYIMSSLSNLSNKNVWTKVGIMPHFMFFKIFANIADFMIDTVPIYGTLRYKGYFSPTSLAAHYVYYKKSGYSPSQAAKKAIIGERIPVKELPFLTSRMGDDGSLLQEKQRERAMMGNMMMLTTLIAVGMLGAFGDDDNDDPFFDVSGARMDIKDQTMRSNPPDGMPPYTIKLGEMKIKYNTKPALTFPFGILGFYRDYQRAGMPDDKISERMKILMWSSVASFMAMTDLQIAGGFKDLADGIQKILQVSQSIKDDPNKENEATKQQIKNLLEFMARKQSAPFLSWLPTKNNMVQQIIQFIDPSKEEAKTVGQIIAYNAGVSFFTNNKSLDITGNVAYSMPGYTNIYYADPLQRKDPTRYEFLNKLMEEKAIPQKVSNQMERVINKPGSETPQDYMLPSNDEFRELVRLAGNKFYEDALKYQNSEAWGMESGVKTAGNKTLLQQRVLSYYSEAKSQARSYLFTWKDFKNNDPITYNWLYENGLMPSVVQTIDVPKLYKNAQGKVVYEDPDTGMKTVISKKYMNGDEVAEINGKAFQSYLEAMAKYRKENPTITPAVRYNIEKAWKSNVESEAALKELQYIGGTE